MDINERRANQILKNETQYKYDPIFQAMVDNTTYLTQAQKYESALVEIELYGYGRYPKGGHEA